MSLRVVVCGVGTTGGHVARVLADVHDVTVVDRLASHHIPAGVRFVHGDATDPGVLLRAGARDADVVVCATRDDPANLLVAKLAKSHFGVNWTVARVADPTHRWLFTPAAGVDVVVSSVMVVTYRWEKPLAMGQQWMLFY